MKTDRSKEDCLIGILQRRTANMSSRGSVAKNGHVGTDQYNTVEVLPSGLKCLREIKGFILFRTIRIRPMPYMLNLMRAKIL